MTNELQDAKEIVDIIKTMTRVNRLKLLDYARELLEQQKVDMEYFNREFLGGGKRAKAQPRRR